MPTKPYCCPNCGHEIESAAELRKTRNADIRAQFKAGKSIKAIAIDLDLSYATAYRAAGHLMTPEQRRVRQEDDRVEAVRRYKAGEGATAIARALGLNRSTVYRWVAGVAPAAPVT